MGILSVANRNLVSNSKSRLKYLISPSASSNLWFTCRISSTAGLLPHRSYAPTLVGDLKSNKKPMFVIEHFHKESVAGNYNSESKIPFPPYNYSLISAEKSWKDYDILYNPFSAIGHDYSKKAYYLAGSCNELMLFFVEDDSKGLWEALWNPTTNNIKILPESDVPRPHPGPVFTNILAHGFGFDPKSADYKLIRFPHFSYEDFKDGLEDYYLCPDYAELYSLKTDSWKKIAYPYPYYGEPDQFHSVHINGVYYWKKDIGILSFDFAIEKFSKPPNIPDFASKKFSKAPHIPLPPNCDERDSSSDDFVLVEFDGSLAALVHSRPDHKTDDEKKPFSFEVWGWNGESWLEKMPRITIHVRGGVVNVVGLFQGDKLFLQGGGGGELLLFDCATSTLENLSGIRADPSQLHIFPYVGSCVPLGTYNNQSYK